MDRIRLGVVDDHPAISAGVPSGLAGLVPLDPDVPCATTVDDLRAREEDLDVVLLDIRLDDGSAPEENVRRLGARGWKVLLYTQERRPVVVGRCLRAGALGVVGKHEDWSALAAAVRAVAGGEDHLNADWAAALESLATPPALTPREEQVLTLYAAGLPMKSVARRMSIAEDTAKEYLGRVKQKYLEAGRPARTKTDLYRRAVEDGRLPDPTDPS